MELESVYRDHRGEVQRFVRSRLGDCPEVSDVCQEVWAAVAHGLEGFRATGSVRAWILGIARHKTLDAWRDRDPCDTLDSQLQAGGALASLVGVRSVTTPSRALSRRRRAAVVREVLERLPAGDRELLELRFTLDLKPAEIAHVLGGVEPNTIAQRIVRATRRLRSELVARGLGE